MNEIPKNRLPSLLATILVGATMAGGIIGIDSCLYGCSFIPYEQTKTMIQKFRPKVKEICETTDCLEITPTK